MSGRLRLILFDVDGTLVDSQGDIVAAMNAAFAAQGLDAPGRAEILSIVGLSLEVAIPRLAPALDPARQVAMVQGYKDAYMVLRAKSGAAESSPLYPGARAALERLSLRPETILGVATGKSRRGLDKLLEGHGLQRMFTTQQVSDHHPSKPHPSMIHAALHEAGVEAQDAVMIGDTSFDMDMARAAGVAAIGVAWGYHPVDALGSAHHIIEDFGALDGVLEALWEAAR
ncbi:HAD-IA family hydrolase [Roseovarius sp. LXJ103]|uniref:HAD-IA family hydrolase n=1 Tax=Roseovarius carneus TaxID=2853164 RepID=UPI000D60500E|nr:HAD-IA family hydrolase [Roseovarius carneus]MBZ8118433.1 HAD-IA family hydrolase [Roseovarius carneus]PWE35863.1 HAD family hydrolase [Pelagicola sp. LXJ1103]